MQKSYFLPDNINAVIHRPVCPKCSAYMMLARIMPARLGFDVRTFECSQCDHVHEVMVATDAFGEFFTTPPAEVGLIMEQKPQHPPESSVWDDRARAVIAKAREMPLGQRRRAALREAGRLRSAAEMNRWLATRPVTFA